jgi:hypothetical protein
MCLLCICVCTYSVNRESWLSNFNCQRLPQFQKISLNHGLGAFRSYMMFSNLHGLASIVPLHPQRHPISSIASEQRKDSLSNVFTKLRLDSRNCSRQIVRLKRHWRCGRFPKECAAHCVTSTNVGVLPSSSFSYTGPSAGTTSRASTGSSQSPHAAPSTATRGRRTHVWRTIADYSCTRLTQCVACSRTASTRRVIAPSRKAFKICARGRTRSIFVKVPR